MRLWSLGARTSVRPAGSIRCTHCGLPAPGAENAPGPVFCCRACRQVHELMTLLTEADSARERSLARAD